MVSVSLGRSWLAGLLLLALVGVSGCQQRAANKLLGKWEGRPDTAAARGERESLKYGDTSSDVAPESGDEADLTDWESYDLSVSLEFFDHKRLEMSLSDGSDSVSGQWRVVSTTPIGCTIEVETAGEAAESEGEESAAVVRRQFQLDLDELEGECVGFTLMEVGADRRLGMLYFSRPEGM